MSKELVRQFLIEAKGKRFQNDIIAKNVGISPSSCRIILFQIPEISTSAEGRRNFYYIKTEEMIYSARLRDELKDKKTTSKLTSFYVPPSGFGDRRKELYPDGRGFISIS